MYISVILENVPKQTNREPRLSLSVLSNHYIIIQEGFLSNKKLKLINTSGWLRVAASQHKPDSSVSKTLGHVSASAPKHTKTPQTF